MTGGALSGRRVVTTRDAPGPLDERLAELGAEVVHVPMIEIVRVPDERTSDVLGRLGAFDWVVVASRHAAAVVAPMLGLHPGVRVAAVGTATAAALGPGAHPLVPDQQTAAGLIRVFPPPGSERRLLVVRGDRSETGLVPGLIDLGYEVDEVVVYRTRSIVPSDDHRRLVEGADAVVFASGSAARAWFDAFGDDPSLGVVAIGPTTSRVAESVGLHVDAVASTHSVDGLIDCVRTLLDRTP